MKVKSLSLAICSILFMPIAHAAPLSFQEAWDLLQQQTTRLRRKEPMWNVTLI